MYFSVSIARVCHARHNTTASIMYDRNETFSSVCGTSCGPWMRGKGGLMPGGGNCPNLVELPSSASRKNRETGRQEEAKKAEAACRNH